MSNLQDSGAYWLGEIPKDWTMLPAWALFAEGKEKCLSDDPHLVPSRVYGVVTRDRLAELSGNKPVDNEASAHHMKHVEPHNFIISMGSHESGIEHSRLVGKVSNDYRVLLPTSGVDPEYYKWFFKSEPLIEGLRGLTTEIRVGQRIHYSRFSLLRLPLPPAEDQERIADYLDRETAEIDAAVADLDRYVELLEKRRQVMIAQSVRGIGSNRTRVHTCTLPGGEGIAESLITDTSTHPVIGDFPNNWEFSRFGREFERSNERNGDSPIGPMLSVSEYRGIEVRTNFRDGQLPSEDVSHYRVVRPGQLVANLMWLDHGGLGVSNFAGYVSPAYMVFNISERVAPAFAHHVLRSSVYVDSYKRLGRGVRPNSQMVDSVDLRQLPFPLPPFETQQRIADYLDRETTEIDSLIADSTRLRDLLLKRRSVLITEVVTGRKQV